MRIKTFLFVLSFALFSGSCGKDPVVSPDSYLARVNNAYLLEKDVDHIPEKYRAGFVSRWIDRELLYQAALKNNIHRDKAVEKQVEDYRKRLAGKFFLETFFTAVPEIKEDALRSYYNDHIDEFIRNTDEAHIYHFVFPGLSEARKAVRVLKNNTSGDKRRELFNSVTVESIVVKKGFLLKELNDVLFNSRSRNKVIGPVKIGSVYHVLEVQERFNKNSRIGFDDAYDEIYQRMLRHETMKIESAVLDSLRDEALIQINQEQLHAY